MASKAGRLQIQMELEVAQLRRDLADATKSIDGATNQWQSSLQGFGDGFKKAIQAGAIALVFQQISAKVSAVIDDMARIGDAFPILQDTAENFQRIEQAANLAGVGIDTVVSSSGRLQKQLSDMSATKAGRSAIAQLGLDVQELEKLSPVDAFIKVGGALGEVKNASEQAAIGSALFGKGWQALLPLIAQGEEGLRAAADAAIVYSDEAVAAGDAFTDSWDRLKASVNVAIAEAITPALPAFTALAQGLVDTGNDATDTGGDFIELGEVAKGLAIVFNNTVGAIQTVGLGVVALGQAIGASVGTIVANIGVLQEAGAKLASNPYSVYSKDFWAGITGSIKNNVSTLSDSMAQIGNTANAQMDAIRQRVESTNAAIQAAKIEVPAARAPTGGGEAESEDKATAATTRRTAAVKQATQATKEKAEADRDAERAAAELKRREEDLTATKLDLAEAIARLNGATDEQIRLWRLNEEGADAWTRQMSDLGAAIDDVAAKTEEQQRQREDVQRQQEQQADAWANFIGAGVSDIFAGIAEGSDAAMEAVKRLISQLLAAIVTAQILKAMGLGTGQVFASSMGSAWENGIRKFSQGGIVSSATPFTFGGGQMGVMGEAGPEAIMPLKRGADGKLGVSGGVNVAVHNYSGASVSVERDEETLRIMVDRVRNVISGDIARGGNSVSASIERTYGVRR